MVGGTTTYTRRSAGAVAFAYAGFRVQRLCFVVECIRVTVEDDMAGRLFRPHDHGSSSGGATRGRRVHGGVVASGSRLDVQVYLGHGPAFSRELLCLDPQHALVMFPRFPCP